MIAVTLRGMAQRRLRLALTALAIVLGVAMVSGSLILTDMISKGFDTIFAASYNGTDAVISGRELVDEAASGDAVVPASLLARVRALPDVQAAAGSLLDLQGESTTAKLLDRDGTPIGSSTSPTFGIGVDPSQPRFNPLRLTAGRWAAGRHEVVIDAWTARQHGFGVGDSIGVAANGPAERFRIVGLARYGDVDTIGGATMAIFSLPTAQAVLGIDGYTAISVAAKPGVATAKLLGELRSLAPATTQVRTAGEQAASDRTSVSGFLSFVRGLLLAFGGIALFVGAFVIVNTLSITVAQRTRELATLRTLGASRRQLLRSVVLEAAVLGLAASAAGVGVGLGLASGLSALVDAVGLTLPQAHTVYAAHSFLVPLLAGTLVTVLAGLLPALRATRVDPIAAIRGGGAPGSRRTPWIALAALGAGAAATAYAVLSGAPGSGRSLLALGAGALLVLLGAAGTASAAVPALARLAGAPSRRFGGAPGALASGNAVRNPGRTAATAAALMVGLALVSFVAVLGSSVRGSVEAGVARQLASDWAITSNNGWSPFPVAAGDAVASVPGVAATSVRGDRGRIGDAEVNVNGIDPAAIARFYRFDWVDGSTASLERLEHGGAIVKEAFARAHGLAAGDRFVLDTPDGNALPLTVAGIYRAPRVVELMGGVLISQQAFDGAFPRPANAFALADGGTRADLEAALSAYPDTKVQTTDEVAAAFTGFLSNFLDLLYVLLALSVVVGLLGMVNTLVLSVLERTRELGMLRAVGMTRRQVRRMVRHESVITALVGAGLGVPLGLGFAAAVTHALGRYDVSFAFPGGTLGAFVLVAVAAGVLAAALPARRAARLRAVAALQYE